MLEIAHILLLPLAIPIIFFFLIPIYFAVGALMGLAIRQIYAYKKYRVKTAGYYVILGGALYTISQPICFLLLTFLSYTAIKLEVYSIPGIFLALIMILFPPVFTITTLVVLTKRYISKNIKKQALRDLEAFTNTER